MALSLPAEPSLEWLRKTAKDHLRTLRAGNPGATLAQAQLDVARQYGFASWRALKAHADGLAAARAGTDDRVVGRFLEHAGKGDLGAVRDAISADPAIVHATGPHPFWGGRPQALHVAVESGHREVFDLLLAAGADPSGRNGDYEHWSPLALAIDRGQQGMRDALLAAGARTGLMEALLLRDDAAVARLPALPAIRPNGGSWLALARTVTALERLLELGADPHLPDRWGTTPIEALSRLGPPGRPLVARLQAHGIPAAPQEHARLGDQAALADLAMRDPAAVRSDAVLTGAADFGHHDLAQWLLTQGADANARSAQGSRGTALHSAAWEGDLRMARILIAHGADPRALDAEHRNTPAGWARVAAQITGNPRCLDVATYLDSLTPDSRDATGNDSPGPPR
jgi:ankyrin repeat protein